MLRPALLIIDDNEAMIEQLASLLGNEFHLAFAQDARQGLAVVDEREPAVIVLNVDLSPNPENPALGMQLLRELRANSPHSKIIVCTSRGGREEAIQAIKDGAHDCFMKPVDLEQLACVVRRACWIWELERHHAVLRSDHEETIEEMIGTSESIRRIFVAIRKVATTDVPVLITGESGTGKELTAKAIHERSLRKNGPFIPINCGAIPDTLLESELFGHEKGAFTGAVQQKKGRIEQAQGGTLFLDEVGELPITLQVKLLRFLQERTFERVGGLRPIEIDVRVISATNVNLKQAIDRGAFREDLYYRLGVLHIHLPALRDRDEDVLLMAKVFLRQASEHYRRPLRGFTKEALQAMRAYSWPGNVRELSNRIRRAVVMAEGPSITPEDLDLPCSRKPIQSRGSLKAARQRLDIEMISQAMSFHQGNISRMAAELGISRPTLYRLMMRYHLMGKLQQAS